MLTEEQIKQAIEQLQLDIKYRKDNEQWVVFKQDVIRTLKWVLELHHNEFGTKV